MANNEVQTSAPDPVAERAAQYALEVTDTTSLHPLRNRIIIVFLSLFVLIGTYGATIGTINSSKLQQQNNLLKNEQTCQTHLLKAITEEQSARAKISADDRSAQRAFNTAISKASSSAERTEAQKEYALALAKNDERRAQYPVPTFDNDVCSTKTGQLKINNVPASTAPSHP